MPDHALAIFAKAPLPGRSKTRMTPPWSPAQAAALSNAFLQDTLAVAARVRDVDPWIFFTPPWARTWFARRLPMRFHLVPQQGAHLTERCAHSVRFLFERGYRRMVQVGTDTPQLRARHLEEALELLESCEMVLGPSRDGGYYLLALAVPVVEIYRDVTMGGTGVARAILANARGLGLRVRLLAEWTDADTHADLQSLWQDPLLPPGPATRRFLAEKGWRTGARSRE